MRYYKILKKNFSVFGIPILSFAHGSTISIGEDIVLISNSFFSEPGVNHPVIIRTVNQKAKIEIGNNVGLNGVTICAAKYVKIGNNCLLGANVQIMDTDFHPIEPMNRRFSKDNIKSKEIIIEDNVFIGMNTLVLKGSFIGENTIIGAGSVVTGYISQNSIATGNPAKVIRGIINA